MQGDGRRDCQMFGDFSSPQHQLAN
jgi:hypothetical protein